MLKLSRGQQEVASKTTLPSYDPSCYLCPGNKRAQGDTNPKYENTYVFVNDYSAVKEVQVDYSQHEAHGSKVLQQQDTTTLAKIDRSVLAPPASQSCNR